ncbi:MAG: hypothetical protein ACKOI2_13235 [Actinomycetota bacterium]
MALRTLGQTIGSVLVRPRLWRTAIGVLRSHLVAGGGRLRFRLPHFAEGYLAFRLETQYGSPRAVTTVDTADVLKYLEWVKDWKARR